METQLIENVAKCVELNIQFDGKVGTTYTVQDLFHLLSTRSLNNLYKATKKKLDDLDTDSLFESKNTAAEKTLQLQVDTIKGVFAYKRELERQEAEKAERLEKRRKLLALRSEKEVEEFKNKTLEEIDAELAKFEV